MIFGIKDKRSGITYVYENKAYCDKDKKQSRTERTLIGSLTKASDIFWELEKRIQKDKRKPGVILELSK